VQKGKRERGMVAKKKNGIRVHWGSRKEEAKVPKGKHKENRRNTQKKKEASMRKKKKP